MEGRKTYNEFPIINNPYWQIMENSFRNNERKKYLGKFLTVVAFEVELDNSRVFGNALVLKSNAIQHCTIRKHLLILHRVSEQAKAVSILCSIPNNTGISLKINVKNDIK